MRISHEESGIIFEITEEKGNFKLHDSGTSRSYTFKEAYEAIWMAIEIIRNISFDILSEARLIEIAKHSHLSLSVIPKSLLLFLKHEKINRTYYDQVFLKLLSNYRTGVKTFTLSNKTNFIVDHEISFLVRRSLGVNLSIPDLHS